MPFIFLNQVLQTSEGENGSNSKRDAPKRSCSKHTDPAAVKIPRLRKYMTATREVD